MLRAVQDLVLSAESYPVLGLNAEGHLVLGLNAEGCLVLMPPSKDSELLAQRALRATSCVWDLLRFFRTFLPDHLKFVKDINDFCRYTSAKMIQIQMKYFHLKSKCP